MCIPLSHMHISVCLMAVVAATVAIVGLATVATIIVVIVVIELEAEPAKLQTYIPSSPSYDFALIVQRDYDQIIYSA